MKSIGFEPALHTLAKIMSHVTSTLTTTSLLNSYDIHARSSSLVKKKKEERKKGKGKKKSHDKFYS